MGHLVDAFSSNLFLAKDDKGMKVPALGIGLNSPEVNGHLEDELFKDPATKWAKLIGVDLDSLQRKGGVACARLVLSFNLYQDESLTWRITVNSSAKDALAKCLCRFKGKEKLSNGMHFSNHS